MFKIIRHDITKVTADVIVNSANPMPVVGSGSDARIYQMAGKEELLAARKEIGILHIGEIGVTPGFNLSCQYIIHLSAPVWRGGDQNEDQQLQAAYEVCLNKAVELGCRSIAFPLISTGTYRFPKQRALDIATSTIEKFLKKHKLLVYLVVYDANSYMLSKQYSDEIEAYIDANYIEEHIEYSRILMTMSEAKPSKPRKAYSNALPDFLKQDDTFIEKLYEWMNLKNMTTSEIYKPAGITKQYFSKMMKPTNTTYVPDKYAITALCVVLGLNLVETNDLLSRAGYALSKSLKQDVIISFGIEKHMQAYEIDDLLYDYGYHPMNKGCKKLKKMN